MASIESLSGHFIVDNIASVSNMESAYRQLLSLSYFRIKDETNESALEEVLKAGKDLIHFYEGILKKTSAIDFDRREAIKQDLQRQYINMGSVAASQGDLDQAIALTQKAAGLGINSTINYYIGGYYLRQERTDIGISYLIKALKKPDQNNENIMKAYDLVQKYALMNDDHQLILGLMPGLLNFFQDSPAEYFSIYSDQISLTMLQKDIPRSLQQADSYLQQTGIEDFPFATANVHYLRSLCLAESQQYSTAMQSLDQADKLMQSISEKTEEMNKLAAEIAISRGRILFFMNEFSQAGQQFEKIINKKIMVNELQLAEVSFMQGKVARAQGELVTSANHLLFAINNSNDITLAGRSAAILGEIFASVAQKKPIAPAQLYEHIKYGFGFVENDFKNLIESITREGVFDQIRLIREISRTLIIKAYFKQGSGNYLQALQLLAMGLFFNDEQRANILKDFGETLNNLPPQDLLDEISKATGFTNENLNIDFIKEFLLADNALYVNVLDGKDPSAAEQDKLNPLIEALQITNKNEKRVLYYLFNMDFSTINKDEFLKDLKKDRKKKRITFKNDLNDFNHFLSMVISRIFEQAGIF